MSNVNTVVFTIVLVLFLIVTVVGFLAARSGLDVLRNNPMIDSSPSATRCRIQPPATHQPRDHSDSTGQTRSGRV